MLFLVMHYNKWHINRVDQMYHTPLAIFTLIESAWRGLAHLIYTKNHFATFVSDKVALLGTFWAKLVPLAYLFTLSDFSTQNLDSSRHFRYVCVRDFNFSKLAKFGIKIGQIRTCNGTNHFTFFKNLFFWVENCDFEISTLSENMVFLH